MEIYYDRLLKLIDDLQHMTIDSFRIVVFRFGLQPYLHVATIGMKRETMQ